jgi:hypothetical protein
MTLADIYYRIDTLPNMYRLFTVLPSLGDVAEIFDGQSINWRPGPSQKLQSRLHML